MVSSLRVQAASIGELYSALGLGYMLSTYLGRRVSDGEPAPARGCVPVVRLPGLLVLAFAGLFNIRSFALALVFIGLMGLGVESTARRAHEHGFHVALPIDAMTDLDAATHDNSIALIFP